MTVLPLLSDEDCEVPPSPHTPSTASAPPHSSANVSRFPRFFRYVNFYFLSAIRNVFGLIQHSQVSSLLLTCMGRRGDGTDEEEAVLRGSPDDSEEVGGCLQHATSFDRIKWGFLGTDTKPVQLPPRDADDQHRLTVVLDLDETLVCAYNAAGVPPSLHANAKAGGLRFFSLKCPPVAEAKENDPAALPPRLNAVTVYERPGLNEFLSRTSQFAEVVLFTAGLEGYAKPLVDHIDPHGHISHRLYRPATVTTKLRENVKDLSILGRDLRRCVIVDNNPFSFLLQPVNGIPCVPFTGHHPEDRQLLDVLLPLLEALSVEPDVRPVLERRFHMPTWFRNRGIHGS
eukprot:TRINITY_DN113_c0_g1_i1.p1 TRINITY_DN113_c0_g1~~TRINITY_DN113_c0_g1_i1.p1  ORF type:complete len:343 (-),score=57.50 TRINITY_DN113_c0_g1_i1:1699-2727(-)